MFRPILIGRIDRQTCVPLVFEDVACFDLSRFGYLTCADIIYHSPLSDRLDYLCSILQPLQLAQHPLQLLLGSCIGQDFGIDLGLGLRRSAGVF